MDALQSSCTLRDDRNGLINTHDDHSVYTWVSHTRNHLINKNERTRRHKGIRERFPPLAGRRGLQTETDITWRGQKTRQVS